MDYSLLLGIHNCDASDQPTTQPPVDLGDKTCAAVAVATSSDEHDSSGSAGTPPDSPLTLHHKRTVSFTAELDPHLESFAIKSTEREFVPDLVLPLCK